MPNSLIQARVDAEAKKNAEMVFSKLGITLSEGIRMFISQVVIEKGLPFKPSLKAEPTPRLKKAMNNALEDKNLEKIGTLEDFQNTHNNL